MQRNKIMHKANSAVMALLLAAMLATSLPASAGIVGTEQMVTHESRAASLAKVETILAKEEVAAQLKDWGVAPGDVSQRVAAMSDAELQQLAATMESNPAGAGALGLIGAVFVVLLILELVGIINIFH